MNRIAVVGGAVILMACGLEPTPIDPPTPGVDGVWVATSFTAQDQLGAPRMVSDGMGGMRQVPRQFEMIGMGGSVTLTIRVDGTYSRQSVMPGFPARTGSEVGEFIIVGNEITFREANFLTDMIMTITHQGDDLTLVNNTDTWDFDEDGSITAQEVATTTQVFRRSN